MNTQPYSVGSMVNLSEVITMGISNVSKVIENIFGKRQYIVYTINVSGSEHTCKLDTLKKTKEFVNYINDAPHWMVLKVEKVRVYNFTYKFEVKHIPLHFVLNSVTEMCKFDEYEFSFLIKDKSLSNVNREK